MKRLAVAALTLAIALPLAAQESPPPATDVVEAAAEAAAAQAETAAKAEMAADVEAAAAEAAAAEADVAAAEAEAAAVEAEATADATSQAEPAAPPAASGQMSAEMQAMMEAWQKASTPGPQHAQLAEHFVGSWDAQTSVWMDPSAPPMTSAGREVTTAEYGGRHLVSQFTGSMMGQPFTGRAVTSYDNTTGQYLASWLDSMSTGHYFATGEYDPASKSYTFTGQMPDPMQPGTSIPIRQVIRVTGPDSHVMEWYEMRDGEETKTMVIEYTRAAAATGG